MSAVLAGARVGEHFARHRAQAECVVEFAIGEQTGIGGDDRAAKLEHQRGGRNRAEAAPDSDSPAGCAMTASLNPG